MLYFCTISAVATRNVKKLFNSDTQASINYLTVLSQFCANYYVSTKNNIMNKTHNVNGFIIIIYITVEMPMLFICGYSTIILLPYTIWNPIIFILPNDPG